MMMGQNLPLASLLMTLRLVRVVDVLEGYAAIQRLCSHPGETSRNRLTGSS